MKVTGGQGLLGGKKADKDDFQEEHNTANTSTPNDSCTCLPDATCTCRTRELKLPSAKVSLQSLASSRRVPLVIQWPQHHIHAMYIIMGCLAFLLVCSITFFYIELNLLRQELSQKTTVEELLQRRNGGKAVSVEEVLSPYSRGSRSHADKLEIVEFLESVAGSRGKREAGLLDDVLNTGNASSSSDSEEEVVFQGSSSPVVESDLPVYRVPVSVVFFSCLTRHFYWTDP